jgi:hypothetical protein
MEWLGGTSRLESERYRFKGESRLRQPGLLQISTIWFLECGGIKTSRRHLICGHDRYNMQFQIRTSANLRDLDAVYETP